MNMNTRYLSLACLPLLLSACSTIIEGHSQEIMVNTSPPGASCVLTRHDETLGTISPTPGAMYLEKTKYDITITCKKAGYDTATYLNHSGEDGVVLGNMIMGGVVGWGIDSATGSDNKYTSPVNITLPRK
jgi:hypothetical protein